MTILFPYPSLDEVRNVLTPIDLNNQVITAYNILKQPDKFPVWLNHLGFVAQYGLVMSNGLSVLGKPLPVTQPFFMQYLKRPSQPSWTESKMWNQRHRSILVLMGWVRYLKKRGADTEWVRENLQIEDLTDVVRRIEDPKELKDEFERIDSRLVGPKIARAYCQFTELPGAYGLYPT